MESSLGEGTSTKAMRGMDADEIKSFNRIQSALALIVYVEAHTLAINPIDFLSRDDGVAHKIRHDAGMEWSAVDPETGLSLAGLFRAYWQSHKSEISYVDLGNTAQRNTLLARIRAVGDATPPPIDEALVAMSIQVSAEAAVFEVTLRDSQRNWNSDAGVKIIKKLDDMTPRLLDFDLHTAFTYKATMGVLVHYIAENRGGADTASRIYDTLVERHAEFQGEVTKLRALGELSSKEEEKVSQCRDIVQDALWMYYNAYNLVRAKAGDKPSA